ncbi:MAG: hypothetical protein CMJ19_23030 [Phycisphaeraceae bacterium]|nr:hypothetical protein [Phycisphaeraceae bacterium]
MTQTATPHVALTHSSAPTKKRVKASSSVTQPNSRSKSTTSDKSAAPVESSSKTSSREKRSSSKSNELVKHSSRSSQKSESSTMRKSRKSRDHKSLERKLLQQVERTQADIDSLVDEVICTGERIVGDIKDAVDDLMGYDSEYAQFLLQRDEEERKRLEYIEELKRKETPLQRQQRKAREARMAKRHNVRNELYRDDRTPIQRLRDAFHSISLKKICKKLEQHGLLMQRWQAATLATLMFMMLATNLTVMGNGGEIQSAPNSYTAYCTNCDHKYSLKRSLFEEYSFYDVHPKDFKLQYHKNQPDYPACPECGVVHQKLILVSRQDRDERFLLATNPFYQMPVDQEGIQKLTEKYN